MESIISLKIKDGEIYVVSPYNEIFVQKAHNLRGKFNAGVWIFDDSLIDYVREIMIEIYGTTGEKPFDTVTLVVKNYSNWNVRGTITLFGKSIARAFGRDSGARLCDDIVFIDGIYRSGGSVKNWYTELKDATFEIHNFPEPSLCLPDVKKAIEEGWVIVKNNVKTRSIEKIKSEIEECNKRMDELKSELENMKSNIN